MKKIIARFLGLKPQTLDTYPLRVVITGLERSGTTLLSTLIKQDPRLDAGFECGFLLAETPRDFVHIQPWYDWMKEPVTQHQWGLSETQLQKICSSPTWTEAYRRLLRLSPVFRDGVAKQVCDKTPRYLRSLDMILDKLPSFVPCLVIEKDIENLWRSHKKRGMPLDEFIRNFTQYNNGLRRALSRHGARIHRLRYEDLCRDIAGCLIPVFSVIQRPYKARYAEQRAAEISTYFQHTYEQAPPLPEPETRKLAETRAHFADILLQEKTGTE